MNDSLLPSRALRVLTAVAGTLWWLLVAFWLVLALAWGVLHGWIVPRVGEWRPQLEMQATRALGVPVRIGHISARSDGLVPTFELHDVVLRDGQAQDALHLGRVVLALSPRSLWQLGFEQLVIENPRLDVRRAADGRLRVAGLDLSREGGDTRAADWFFRQKEVLIQGGSVRWIDEMRGAPPVILQDLRFISRNSLRRHLLRLDARPPAEWGEGLTVMGMFRQPFLSTHAGRWQDWTGQFYAQWQARDLSALPDHAALGAQVLSGEGALRAWIDVDQGRWTGVTTDLALRGVKGRLGEQPPLALAQLEGRLAGKRLKDGYEFATRGLQLQPEGGRPWPGGNVSVAWREPTGRLPGQGQVSADHLDLDALAQLAAHLPMAPAWRARLEQLAPGGVVESINLKWQGPVDQPTRYEARGRASGLSWTGAAGLPALRGASLNFDANDAGGKARVVVHDGAADLPGVLQDPVIPIQQLEADLQWRRAAGRWSVETRNLEFRNADVQGRGQVAWRSADGPRGSGPGVIDLQLALPRADGARIWRYLPMAVGRDAREYVRQSVVAAKLSDAQVRLRGDLREFPFAARRGGEFRVTARVRDATYAFAPAGSASPSEGSWPALTQLSGELVFDGPGLQVRGAQGRFATAPNLAVQADASVSDLAAPVVAVNGQVRGPLSEALAVFNALPVAASLGRPLAQASGSGPSEVRLKLALPVAQMDRAKVQGSVVLAGNDVQLRPDVPLLARARGTVNFSEAGFGLAGVQARALGGELRIEGGTRTSPAPGEAGTSIRVQGMASAEGLQQAAASVGLGGLARQASGSASYEAALDFRDSGVDVAVTSSLQGLALNLPAPLNKPAESALPLRFEMAALPGAARPTDQLSLAIGEVASASFVRDVSGARPRVLRGAVGIGLGPDESAPLPARGVMANLQFAGFDVDAWQRAFEPVPGAAGAPPRGPAASGLTDYLPTLIALRARELTAQGRTLHRVVVGGSREGTTWRANVDAQELNGYVEFRQPAGADEGRVTARLARLSLVASAASEVETLLDAQPTSMPSLDIEVDDFELRGRRLGRLDIEAFNSGGSRPGANEWRLDRLNLTLPEGVFSASGNWALAGAGEPRATAEARRRTVMNFRLDIVDAGQLLARMGMPGVVRRGRGKLEGQVAWRGSPLSIDYPSLAGNMAVNLESGQFLKADPGLAKLLSVLSLQSLPRRLNLDFRDIFSEGFAFDFVRGHVTMEQGVAATNNLQMKGVNAAVLMEGHADVARETQDLKVVVVPEINAGTASLVAGVINPAIGLGTFLAQMFLREPLMRLATQEFHLTGTWADPQVARVGRRTEARTGTERAPGPAANVQGSN